MSYTEPKPAAMSRTMKTTITTVALGALSLGSLYAASGVAPASDAGTSLRFIRPERVALAVTTTETHELELTKLTTQFGEADPIEQPTSMRLRSLMKCAVADERSEGAALRRRYVASEATLQVMDPSAVNLDEGTWQGLETKLVSPVDSVSVVFVPAEGQPEGWGRHFDARALRETILPKLTAPANWSDLLPAPTTDAPSAEIELGDSWDIDPKRLESLLAPGGFMAWRPGEEQSADAQILRAFHGGVGGNLQLAFDGTVNGKATGRLQTVGVDPDDGRYAEIKLEYELQMTADQADYVDQRRLEEEGELDVEMLGADLQVGLVGEGTLRWSLDENRPLRAFLAARENVEMTVRLIPRTGNDEGKVVSQSITMKGTLVNNMKCRTTALSPVKRTVVEGR